MVSKKNKTLILRLVTALVLSSSLICSSYAEEDADFSYFSLVEAKPIKLIKDRPLSLKLIHLSHLI